jgi:flagellar biosynthetic protein FliO
MAFKVLGSVLLLIGMLYAGVYGMKVLSRRAGKAGLGSGAISVLHKTHIAPKKAIYVVKVGRKAMVVGVTDTQINHLSDLTEEELGSLEAPDRPKAKSFKQHLLGFALGAKERS